MRNANFNMALRVGVIAVGVSVLLKFVFWQTNQSSWFFGPLYGLLSAVLWCFLNALTGQVLIARDKSEKAILMEGVSSLILPLLVTTFLLVVINYRILRLWYRFMR